MDRYLLPLLAALGLACCASPVAIDPQSAIRSDEDAYFIMGVAPDNIIVWIGSGAVEDGRFRPDLATKFLPPALLDSTTHGLPDHGYVVAKATAGTTLAITGIQYGGDTFPSHRYDACATMVFTAEPGKVVYAGDVEFAFQSGHFGARPSKNIAAAKAFLTEHYPQLADKLEEGSARLMRTAGCGQ